MKCGGTVAMHFLNSTHDNVNFLSVYHLVNLNPAYVSTKFCDNSSYYTLEDNEILTRILC